MLFEKDVNSAFEHKAVVDGDCGDFGDAEPAGLPTAGVGAVHDVV